jgi:hypothetical protein
MWLLLIILSWFNLCTVNVKHWQAGIDAMWQQVQDNRQPAQDRRHTWQVLRKID